MIKFNQEPSAIIETEYKKIYCFDVHNDQNIDSDVVKSFGEEWQKFNSFSALEIENLGKMYFDIVDEKILNKNTYAIDIGCGSGRFSQYLLPRIGFIEAIDPSNAIYSANLLLKDHENVRLSKTAIDNLPFDDKSFDFAMSIGVLHHIPDTQKAMNDCVKKVKIGGYFYTYLYYNLDNKGFVYKLFLYLVTILRRLISGLPTSLKQIICDVIAIFIYLPFVLIGRFLNLIGLKKIAKSLPLSIYQNQTFFIIRNDALDRFGTKLEQRFSKIEIEQMMKNAGLDEIKISQNMPYWHAIGKKIAE